MSDLITLAALDADGAIQETAEAAGATRADFLKRGGVAGAGFLAGGVLFNGLISPADAAISTHKRSKKNDVKIANYALTLEYLEAEFYKQAATQRRGHEARAAALRQRRRRARGRARQGAAQGPRVERGQEAEVRLRRHGHQPGQVQADRAGAGGHGRVGVRRPGPEPAPASARRGGPLDPLGRGAPRGVDPLPQLGGGGRTGGGNPANYPAPRAFDKAQEREEGPQRRHGDGLHQGLASGARWARRRSSSCGAARRRAPRSPRP